MVLRCADVSVGAEAWMLRAAEAPRGLVASVFTGRRTVVVRSGCALLLVALCFGAVTARTGCAALRRLATTSADGRRVVEDRPTLSRDWLIVSSGSMIAVSPGSVTGKRGTVMSSGLRVITVPVGPRSTIVSTGSVVTSRVITVCAL